MATYKDAQEAVHALEREVVLTAQIASLGQHTGWKELTRRIALTQDGLKGTIIAMAADPHKHEGELRRMHALYWAIGTMVRITEMAPKELHEKQGKLSFYKKILATIADARFMGNNAQRPSAA